MTRFLLSIFIILFCFSCKNKHIRDISHVTDLNIKKEIIYNKNIKSHIPNGMEILGIDSGFVNSDDSIYDCVLVLKQINEKDYICFDKKKPIRPTMIILGQPNNGLQLISKCDSANYPFYLGGMVDPFHSVKIDSTGTITLINAGGSGNNRWECSAKFRYDKVLNNIVLVEYHHKAFEDIDPPEHIQNEKLLTTKDFGRVIFEEYSIYQMNTD
jgi:hypothetical protein